MAHFCGACGSLHQVSRRQFLCTSAVGAVAAPAIAAGVIGPANAQQPGAPVAGSGRPLLIKGGCVLTLDRAIGDFDRADVLVEGSKISAVRPTSVHPTPTLSTPPMPL
jgi:hypothetical protein